MGPFRVVAFIIIHYGYFSIKVSGNRLFLPREASIRVSFHWPLNGKALEEERPAGLGHVELREHPMDSDTIIERRKLRRRVSFWRASALVLVAVGIIAAVWAAAGGNLGNKSAPHIAKIRIEGTITEDEKLIELIERATKADQVKGVVLAIDSPGGTTAGGEAIYEAVRKLAEKKPVVAQVGTLAASAGYMIACATDHIVARQSSIVGSIGVLVQIPNVKGLLDKIGVEVDTIKSAPLKAEPSPFNETTEAEREMMRAMIMDSFNWFEGIVIERRPLSAEEVRALADGSVFTGRQALQRKLIDELGGPDRARDWLTGKGLDSGLKVVEWKKPQDGALGGFPLSLAGLRDWVSGRDGAEERLLRRIVGDGVFLDGLLSLWQPSPLVPERSE